MNYKCGYSRNKDIGEIIYFAGSVGKPFPNMEVCIVKPNVYAEQGYDVLVYSNHRRTRITPGQNQYLSAPYSKFNRYN